MWFSLKSLRQKFFFAFLTFVLVAVLIAFISAWSYQRYEKLNQVVSLAEELQMINLEISNAEQDFFYYEMINPTFFKTKRSKYLESHEALVIQLKGKLDSFPPKIPSIFNSYQDISLNQSIVEASRQLIQYEETFEKVVKLSHKRGFKDFGLEGSMREKIHSLEDKSPIAEGEILMLRRHEKDYIIRKDDQYADKLNLLVENILEGINKQTTLSQEEKEKWRNMIKSYRRDFMQIVALEHELGLKQNEGLRKELKTKSEALQKHFSSLSAEVREQIYATQERFYYFYLALIIFILIITVFVSSLMAKAITQPLLNLKNKTRRRIKEIFDLNYLPKNYNNEERDEIETLQRDFNFLLQEIQEQLKQVKQSNKELEDQNEELNSINAQLIVSEKDLKKLNQVKDKFFSIISHDLRSPLHSLTGFLDVMKNHADSFTPEETKNFAENMDDAIARILELLENLLNWSLSQTGDLEYKPEMLSISDIFEKNLELYQTNAQKKGIQLQSKENSSDYDMKVWADRNMLNFIIRNLISNAIKFTEAGGEIILDCEKEEVFDEVVISVKDTGVGMTQEVLEKIFLKEEHISEPGTDLEKGTGFGLTLCKDFVEKNAGSIGIESELGKGSTIFFTLKTTENKATSKTSTF